MMETYACPVIGNKPIADVTTADIIRILATYLDVETRNIDTRVKRRLSAIFDYASERGYTNGNPVPHKLKSLPTLAHVKAIISMHLPFAAVPAAVAEIQSSGANELTKLALEFLILTAASAPER